MLKTRSGFSIIEIIISTVILTMGVFGVYKLIGNNMNAISHNESLVQQNLLYSPLRECLKSMGYDSMSGSYNVGSGFSINFGTDNMGCQTGSYDDAYNFSGVLIDTQEYFLYGNVTSKNTTQIVLELNIYSPLNGELFLSGADNEANKYLTIKKP